MKFFLKKIIKKYRDMSVEMKAASWYAVGNIIQKIAPWLVNDYTDTLLSY